MTTPDLAAAFQPGTCAILARAGDYLHVFAAADGAVLDLERQRFDVTTAVADALNLPLTAFGLLAQGELALIRALADAVPGLIKVGFADRLDTWHYAVPGVQRYRVRDGQVEYSTLVQV